MSKKHDLKDLRAEVSEDLSKDSKSNLSPSNLSPLTPRQTSHDISPMSHSTSRAAHIKRWCAALISAAVAAAVLFLIFNLLGDAALFFYNVDEAIERRSELGERRFKVQGTPTSEPVADFIDDKPALSFIISFNEAHMQVMHVGDPPDLFQTGVPVVLEGSWKYAPDESLQESFQKLEKNGTEVSRKSDTEISENWYFFSDRMLVKHDNEYRNRDEYENRITDADTGGQKTHIGDQETRTNSQEADISDTEANTSYTETKATETKASSAVE